MDFLVRRRSFNLGQKEIDLRISFTDSPLLSRRRSVSPLMSPMSGNGPLSIFERNKQEPSFPQTEDEQLYSFHERILWNQERSLLPLAHDLSDWMSGILGINLCPSNFLEVLATGVILCQLAKLIEGKASGATEAKVRPRLIGRVRQNARPGSFFARDNVALFLNFCRDLGVHPNLRFETNDLVSHGDIRSVLICLMEVGRLSVKYGIDPPALVAMEHEIDNESTSKEDNDKTSECTVLQSQSDNQSRCECGSRNSFGSEMSDDNKENPLIPKSTNELGVQTELSDSVDSGLLIVDVDEDQGITIIEPEPTSELDVKINDITRISGQTCRCVEETRNNFKLRKLSEGKYLINGRTVFVRLLKGVHVMVRIGGGWETLEEFLVRNDPCRGRRVNRRPSYYQGMNPASPYGYGRPASSPPVMMLGTGLRPVGSTSCCSTPQRSRHSSNHSLNLI